MANASNKLLLKSHARSPIMINEIASVTKYILFARLVKTNGFLYFALSNFDALMPENNIISTAMGNANLYPANVMKKMTIAINRLGDVVSPLVLIQFI
jgi:hypothetical protein